MENFQPGVRIEMAIDKLEMAIDKLEMGHSLGMEIRPISDDYPSGPSYLEAVFSWFFPQ